MILIVAAFFVPKPAHAVPQGLRAALVALRDSQVKLSMWLTTLAGLAFGALDVLAPLRLRRLGTSALLISATFLAAAAIEATLSPVAGRLTDRYGEMLPVRISLIGAVVLSVLAPVTVPAALLMAVLIVGMPSFSRCSPRPARCSARARTGSGSTRGWPSAWATWPGPEGRRSRPGRAAPSRR